MREIGSDFWELPSGDAKRRQPFWWEQEGLHRAFFRSGRNAFRALSDHLKQSRARVLMPGHHCHTETESWYMLDWEVGFYPIGQDFTIDAVQLEKQIDQFSPEVIVVQRSFGFNTIGEQCARVLGHFRSSGGIVIEDITQSLLTDRKYGEADYYIASLRKFFAIPDGGVVISERELPLWRTASSDGTLPAMAMTAYQGKQGYFSAPTDQKKAEFRKQYEQLFEEVGKNDRLYAMSDEAGWIFDRVNREEIRAARRSNYRQLSDRLKECDRIRLPLELADADTVPLYLPVLAQDEAARASLRRHLTARSIYCPIIWPRPADLPLQDEGTEAIYERILCIPIDQRYDAGDMDRIAVAINEWSQMQ